MPAGSVTALSPTETVPAMAQRPAKRVPADRARARLLLDISNRIAAMHTLTEQFAALVAAIADALDAEVATLFLNDGLTGELYSHVKSGGTDREIRIVNSVGIAGNVFSTGQGLVITDAYSDNRFDRTTDEKTGFTTRSICCAPMRTMKGEVIGVTQALNKQGGVFNDDDLALLEAISLQASVALQSSLYVEKMERARQREEEFLAIVAQVSAEIQLGPLLQKIMGAVTRMLDAERSTLFINDEKSNELFTEIGQGLGATKIRFPNHLGIAGAVFTSRKSINIPYAYADLRFNPTVDKQTGFFTRSILCVPLINKDGKTIGVTQVLNKRGGPFNETDEQRLQAFTAQISIGLENAKLFDDVQNMKNYNESILESMSNGVVTLNADKKIMTMNAAAYRIMKTKAGDVLGKKADDFFADANAWIVKQIDTVVETQQQAITMDSEMSFAAEKTSANLTVLPLKSPADKPMGSMLLIEDISSEKRVRSTMARYMDPNLANQLLSGGQDVLGGLSSDATVLFSDVRGFTTLSEELGPQGIVQLLNEYFTVMVDCLTHEGGMLDKFIGDAIMAVFGLPLPHGDDEDRAVRCGISMLSELTIFNNARKELGKRPVEIGIGINTDSVVSGNIGSPKRMDYTVIGDGVNLAARLESASKQYKAQLLISEFTRKKLKGTYRMREADRVIVKGKTQPVGIYELLDFHTEASFPNMRDVLGHFQDGLALYRDGSWDKAIAAFEGGLKANPKDGLSKIYVERCEFFKAEPPDDWDGVWKMTDK